MMDITREEKTMSRNGFLNYIDRLYEEMRVHLEGASDPKLNKLLHAFDVCRSRMAISEYKLFIAKGFRDISDYEAYLKKLVSENTWAEAKVEIDRVLMNNMLRLRQHQARQMPADLSDLIATVYILHPARVVAMRKVFPPTVKLMTETMLLNDVG
jgi:DnaJ-domain-containing protein 1